MMRHADHHGFPILSFIDTPGAYAGIKAEELGQVSCSLYLVSLLNVPLKEPEWLVCSLECPQEWSFLILFL